MRSIIKALLLLFTALILLSACSSSFADKEKETISAVQVTLKEKAKKPNKENDVINYYLPFGFEVEKETDNNIILKNGSKTYILFYNQIEGKTSEVVYKTTAQQGGTYTTDKVFKLKDRFGYLLIKKMDDENCELTVGVGGIKVTTNTKVRSLNSEADMMMRIAQSVTIKESK